MPRRLPVSIPDYARSEVLRRWPTLGRRWCAVVLDELAELATEVGGVRPAIMESRYGLVVAVDSAAGPLVLRSSPDPDGQDQVRHHERLAAAGVAPTIRRSFVTPTSTWTVMDRVVPGTTFYDADLTDEVLQSLAAMLRSLDAAADDDEVRLPPLTSWLRERLDGAWDDDVAPGHQPAPARERKGALDVLDQLDDTPDRRLGHGDTSPGNLLLDAAGNVLLVDPRGMVGEVAYDAAVAIIKVRELGVTVDIDTFAQRAGLDPERIRAWMVVATAARV